MRRDNECVNIDAMNAITTVEVVVRRPYVSNLLHFTLDLFDECPVQSQVKAWCRMNFSHGVARVKVVDSKIGDDGQEHLTVEIFGYEEDLALALLRWS